MEQQDVQEPCTAWLWCLHRISDTNYGMKSQCQPGPCKQSQLSVRQHENQPELLSKRSVSSMMSAKSVSEMSLDRRQIAKA